MFAVALATQRVPHTIGGLVSATEKAQYIPPHLCTVLLCTFIVCITLPAWRYFILTKAMELEKTGRMASQIEHGEKH